LAQSLLVVRLPLVQQLDHSEEPLQGGLRQKWNMRFLNRCAQLYLRDATLHQHKNIVS